MRTLRLAAVALATVAALSACGGQDGTGTPTTMPTSTGASPVTDQPPTPSTGPATPTPPSVSTPPRATTKPGGTIKPGGPTLPPPVAGTELTGTIVAGVEANCLLLDGYLLIGGPRDVLAVGARVTVTGRVQRGMMTTCQQGTPFVVEAARRS
ncbi:hypothetical protein [Micromonospora avicenniae]|uniref:Uncharacterized protein n=1 Tax=Micromonospora avicenniae TaxID=1198245 RepID=A0A1N7AGQ0_9ACTN|nr:hypothetical protein [Micromonospora avicenniae]SIR38209.1 hypothetical protein SAMN05444858_109113 [Micromonospora avicenniae]